MRKRADGCILYSFAEAEELRAANPMEQVWVAPNALYSVADIRPFRDDVDPHRPDSEEGDLILYVGRLEPAKKPGLLLEAFALLAQEDGHAVLCFVGAGVLASILQSRAAELGLASRVRFEGSIDDVDILRELYKNARVSVSPGYCGLSLTQSMCFGVPMVVADAEPHAPEVELSQLGLVTFFEANSSDGLARVLSAGAAKAPEHERAFVVDFMRHYYSAEAMAEGLLDALANSEQQLFPDLARLQAA